MPESVDSLSLKIGQLIQINDQARYELYHMEIKFNLLIKMLEEKGLMASGEFDKRWPLYLKNDVGALGPDGIMEGSCSIKFYGLD